LRDLPEILASAKAFVGNDSGVTHLASLLGVPTVALFGPTHPATWSPIGPAVKIVRACSEPPRVEVRVCRDPHCLEGISPEDVLAALNRLLAQPNQRKMAELLD